MKFLLVIKRSFIFLFYKTALHIAVENGNIEIVQLLLTSKKIDVNILKILFCPILYNYYLTI